MAGYQTIEAMRPILHRGPVATPVVDRALTYKPRRRDCPTYQQVRQMIELRSQGKTLPEIARTVGFTNPTVRRHTQHVPPPVGGWAKGGRKPRVKREFVMRLHRAGFSYSEIADECSCHPSNIGQIIKGWSKPKARAKARPTLYCEKVVERVTGFTVADLREADQRGPGQRAKARAILCWLVKHKRPALSYNHIAEHLGGYDRSTPRRACAHVDEVLEHHRIKLTGRTQHVVERLWALDWREVGQ